jgi:MazG family protein
LSADEARPPGATLTDLVEVMRRLLAPDGCPWDRAQSFASLRPFVLEEAYEVVDAIDGGDRRAIAEELGDLLFQVVFQSELGRAEGAFDIDDVIVGITEKMVRRHPHVFGDGTAANADEVLAEWEVLKAEEKAGRGVLEGLPVALPSLLRAQRIGEKAARVGFDWADVAGVRAKVDEELGELDEALGEGDREAVERELGDVLFALASLARKEGLDAEAALRGTLERFQRRFAHIEAGVREAGEDWEALSAEELDGRWQAAKRLVRDPADD